MWDLDASPAEIARAMRSAGVRRAWVRTAPSGAVECSADALAPVADWWRTDRVDYLGHEAAFLETPEHSEVLYGAFLHRTVRGPGAGGVRFWEYPTLRAYLRDGMRLATGMGRKNALAGLWWGGGKGVIARDPSRDPLDPEYRAEVYRGYGRFMTSLCGCYVTAEDVGTCVPDMAHVFARTRFTTCIPEELGGSGNPSVPTARGVVAGIEAALRHVDERGLEGRAVAIQGTGNVGRPLARFLLERGVGRIVACDVQERHVEAAREELDDARVTVRHVARGDLSILAEDCDVLAPCATGGVLGPDTIPGIRARVVCGAANNQLVDPARDGRALHDRGVLYVPDFLVNRMGIVNCADEHMGTVARDPRIERHLSRAWAHSIPCAIDRVVERSRATGHSPDEVAVEIADRQTLEPHPLFGHRGAEIVEALVTGDWVDRRD